MTLLHPREKKRLIWLKYWWIWGLWKDMSCRCKYVVHGCWYQHCLRAYSWSSLKTCWVRICGAIPRNLCFNKLARGFLCIKVNQHWFVYSSRTDYSGDGIDLKFTLIEISSLSGGVTARMMCDKKTNKPPPPKPIVVCVEREEWKKRDQFEGSHSVVV